MSGIFAVWDTHRVHARDMLASVAAGLSFARDSALHQTDEGVGVGVSSRFSSQQIFANDSVLLVCDAELYNEDELRKSLNVPVPAASPNVSTAALLAEYYATFGSTFVDKLRGGFSVILWDRRENRLMAAVDTFGIKRLAYYGDSNAFIVASRVDAIAGCEHVDRTINPRAVPNILNFSANLAPETFFSKIHRLEPASIVVADGVNVRVRKYWEMRYGVGEDSNENRLSRELERIVEQSVAMHFRGNTRNVTGAFLSGGTDSSSIVGLMARIGQTPVKAFSIGFHEENFNELEYARIAAKAFGAEHHTYLVRPDDCFQAITEVVRAFDEPFGNSSAVATYFCARLAAQNGVKILLAGDGGDELFGGNEWYRTDKVFKLYENIPSVLRKRVIEPSLTFLPGNVGIVRRLRGYVRRANLPDADRSLSFQFLATHSMEDILDGDFVAALGGYSFLDRPRAHYETAPAADHLDRLLYRDVKMTLGDNDLPKVTCSTELAGVQARFPFLDRSVAEFSGSIPTNLKVKGLNKRYLFKRAFGNLLPPEILQKRKHGFGIPVATWLKSDRRMNELCRDTLLSARALQRGYFRRDFVQSLFNKHAADTGSYYGDILWTVLAIELWHRVVLDEPARVAV